MLQRSILCMQGTQYATKRSILCRGAFCGPTEQSDQGLIARSLRQIIYFQSVDEMVESKTLF